MLALAIGSSLARLVVDPSSPPPMMEPDAAVLFVHRPAVSCTGSDAGIDAGVPVDAAAIDAGMIDAGMVDAGVIDAGGPPASCGDTVMMVIQPRFGLGVGGGKFALLMVTPADPAIRIEAASLFADLDRATAPLVHDVEVDIPDPSLGTVCSGDQGGGCGGGGWSYPVDSPRWTAPGLDGGFADAGTAFQTIGPYDVARDRPATRVDLASWLDSLGYAYQSADLDAITPYLLLGWTVVAIRVDTSDPIDGGLEPLSLTWSGAEIRLPLGLAQQAAAMPTTLAVYIADEHRLDLPGAHVSFAGELAMAGASFVTRNDVTFDATQGADADPIAAAVPGDPTTHDIVDVQHEVHVPVTTTCSNHSDDGCGCAYCDSQRGSGNGVLYAAAVVLALRRRRR